MVHLNNSQLLDDGFVNWRYACLIIVYICYQEKMVDDNMLKLDLKRLRDALYQKAGKVVSQEKHKLKLDKC